MEGMYLLGVCLCSTSFQLKLRWWRRQRREGKGREGRGIVNAADNQSIVLINDLIDDFINRREWIDNGDMEITCRARHAGPAHISRRMLFKLRDCR